MQASKKNPGAAWTRRSFLHATATAVTMAPHAHDTRAAFTPTWESLIGGYRAPDWFRDAKFGIWAHWTSQCVPEMGDWYARNMYIQGHAQYQHHVESYGHPTQVGYMEMNHRWQAEHWDPTRCWTCT
jgi:alpha-L-fucosidase